MANFHIRSNNFPSQSHPLVDDVENHLCRLKSSAQATSSSAICSNLASLRELHESITNLIQMPLAQQAISNEQGEKLLEGSLRLVDLCEISREIICSTKESVQQLESSIRRNNSEIATAQNINAYMASKKKINKMASKCIKNLKCSNHKDNKDLNTIEMMLKETETAGFSILKSAMMLVSGVEERSKQKGWSFLSKFGQSSLVHSEISLSLEQLKGKEMSIQEIEEGLETLFRNFVKTRVSLLNVLSHQLSLARAKF